ncbi:MAG: anti-sigma F factor [Clostridia bacterium]|nr:anti-sigma F factor [Clostridia bacterium]
MENYMRLEFPSKSQNESLARSVVGVFATQLDLTVEELADIKTAVSEAVTNAIIHGYANTKGTVEIIGRISGNEIAITITDTGSGIPDIDLAMQPLYSGSADEDRSGMGFTVMESFMDTLKVDSEPGKGTSVTMTKRVGVDAYA